MNNSNSHKKTSSKEFIANALSKVPILNIFIDKELALKILGTQTDRSLSRILMLVFTLFIFLIPSIVKMNYFKNLHFSYFSLLSFVSTFKYELYFIGAFLLVIYIIGKTNFSKPQKVWVYLFTTIMLLCYVPLGITKLKIYKYTNGPLSLVEHTISENYQTKKERLNEMVEKHEWKYFRDYFYESKNYIELKELLSPQLETQIIELRNEYSSLEYLDFLVFCSKITNDNALVLHEMKKLERQFKKELRESKNKDDNYKFHFSREFKVLNGDFDDVLLEYDKKQIESTIKNNGYDYAVNEIVNSEKINHWFDEIKAANILYK